MQSVFSRRRVRQPDKGGESLGELKSLDGVEGAGCGALAGSIAGGGVGVVGIGGLVKADDAGDVVEEQLPVVAEVAEDADNGALARGNEVVLERGVGAGADVDAVAGGVLGVAVGVLAAGEGLAGLIKGEDVDAHELALVLEQNVLALAGDFGQGDEDGVDLGGVTGI